MIRIDYDPILGCVGWEFTSPFNTASKKKGRTKLTNTLRLPQSVFLKPRSKKTPRESEDAFAPKNVKNWDKLK